jgi:hypothetical protein
MGVGKGRTYAARFPLPLVPSHLGEGGQKKPTLVSPLP